MNVIHERSTGIIYFNSSGYTKRVSIGVEKLNKNCKVEFWVNGDEIHAKLRNSNIDYFVPNGSTYELKINGAYSIISWEEDNLGDHINKQFDIKCRKCLCDAEVNFHEGDSWGFYGSCTIVCKNCGNEQTIEPEE